MPLESGTYISDLVAANPPDNDPATQGAAHLRLIKEVLLNTFAAMSGAVTAAPVDLNKLTGLVTTAAELALLSGVGNVWSTGDVKLTLKTVADSSWVLMNDTTIGDASSGATGRANADTAALFTLLWTNTADAQCAVSSGRGGSAAADFAAHKTINLPKALGRALATYGSGSGLTARALALTIGEETHTLTGAESGLPAHTHPIPYNSGGGTGSPFTPIQGTTNNLENSTFASFANTAADAASAHNNMQPTLFLNVMIKL